MEAIYLLCGIISIVPMVSLICLSNLVNRNSVLRQALDSERSKRVVTEAAIAKLRIELTELEGDLDKERRP